MYGSGAKDDPESITQRNLETNCVHTVYCIHLRVIPDTQVFCLHITKASTETCFVITYDNVTKQEGKRFNTGDVRTQLTNYSWSPVICPRCAV